jgi:glutathione S-transferase
MILIGQYDSPFVRRVAVALQHYALAYEHRPWSVWAQAEEIARFNPHEKVLRSADARSAVWIDRCDKQMGDVLSLLEAERANEPGDHWFGRFGHADIAVACALRFLGEAHPALFARAACPALRAAAARCEAMASFQVVVQPLHVAV